MIKGTSLISLRASPNKALWSKIFCPKTSSFRTPYKDPWTDVSETYGQLLPSEALYVLSYLAQTAFGRLNSLKKQTAKYNNMPAGGCNDSCNRVRV